MVVTVLFKDGDQVPTIPLREVVGNAKIVSPKQTGGIAVNVGVTFWLTVITNVVEIAQKPALGIKV